MRCPVCSGRADLQFRKLVVDTLVKEYKCADGHITRRSFIIDIYSNPKYQKYLDNEQNQKY